MNTGNYLLPLAVLMLAVPGLQAQESEVISIEGTRIRGDQETPTVMYLVPWQPPTAETLPDRDERLMVSQTFAPVERYEFQRLVKYYGSFRQRQEEAAVQGRQP